MMGTKILLSDSGVQYHFGVQDEGGWFCYNWLSHNSSMVNRDIQIAITKITLHNLLVYR